MGNSPPQVTLTQKQKDLQYLAQRHAFGNAEFHHLYDCYHSLLSSSEQHGNESDPPSRTLFVREWAVECFRRQLFQQSTTEADQTEEKMQLVQEYTERVQILESYILIDNIGNRLYEHAFVSDDGYNVYKSSNDTSMPTTIDDETRLRRLQAFFEGLSQCGGRRGSKAAVLALCSLCSRDDGKTVQALELISIAYRLALASAFLKTKNGDYVPPAESDESKGVQVHLNSLANSMVEYAKSRRQRLLILSDNNSTVDMEDFVTRDDVVEWVDAAAPVFGSILPTFIYDIFFPFSPYPPSRTPFEFPHSSEPSSFIENLRSPLLFTLGCLSSGLSGTYFRLYTSDSDGLSFNRLQNALLGYSGPTLLLIRSTTGGVFGAYTASPWKESKDFYGTSDSFLFQASPLTHVYRPSGNATNYMYCNSTARSRGYDQQAHGIGFGGTVEQPRLFLSESFDDCYCGTQDLTFENGSLLPKTASGAVEKYFTIDALEVYGCGGTVAVQAALESRQAARQAKEEEIRRARKVDKAQFLDDFRSGVIDSKAFAHRQQIDGRADDDCRNQNEP